MPHLFVSQAVISDHLIRTDVLALAPGTFHTLFVNQDGSVWSTGISLNGHSKRLVKLIPSGATTAAAGNYFSIALKQDGSVFATGKTSKGQLSVFDASATSNRMFSFVQKISGAKTVAAGGYHSLILTRLGVVWNAGWNMFGQLGDGSKVDRTRFSRVISDGAVDVAAGDIHSVVLKQDGSVWAAGRNHNGQLGDGTTTDRSEFVQAMVGAMPASAVSVAAGGYHSMVLKRDGSVWTTGWNEYGQLGDGSTVDKTNYVKVFSSGAKAVSVGSRHSIMLGHDGSVWATGYNVDGQLGDGSKTNSKIFVEVISDGVKAVAAGGFHSMVLNEDGSVWAAGSNQRGQLGERSSTVEESFVRIAPFGNGTDTVIHIWILPHNRAIAILFYAHVVFAFLPCFDTISTSKRS